MKGPVPLLTATLLAAAPSAFAAEGPRLEYTQGPAECPDADGFRREAAIRGDGAELFSQTAADVLRVRFEQLGPNAYRGGFTYINREGRTEKVAVFVDKDCRWLGRAVAVSSRDYLPKQSIAAPDAAAPAPDAAAPAPDATAPAPDTAAPAPPAAAPPRVLAVATSAPASQPAPPSKSLERVAPPLAKKQVPEMDFTDVTITPRAAFVASVGYADNVAPGFEVVLGIKKAWFSLELGFRGLLPSDVLVTEKVPGAPAYGPPFRQQVSLWTAVVAPCVHVATYFFGCAAMQVGGLVVKAPFVSTIKTGAVFMVGPRLGVELPFAGRFAVAAFAEMPVQIVRVDLADAGPSPPFTNRHWPAPAVYGVAGASFEVRFQ